MNKKLVKNLMVPLEEYAVVTEKTTLLDAILELDKAILKLPPGRQKHRAVLVVNTDGKVIGKIGHLAFLKALEPGYNVLSDLDAPSLIGISADVVESMMRNYNLFQDDITDICRRASVLKVTDVMHPVSESIDENATLAEGAHKIIIYQSMSLLVTRKGKVVGVLRISDLFEELASEMKRLADLINK